MRLKTISLCLEALLVFCVVTFINGEENVAGTIAKHTGEDVSDKNLQAEAVTYLKNKISLLEGSITNMTEGIQQLVRQNQELHKLIVDNRRNEVGGTKTKPSLCSDSCGGVIEGEESGEIIYKEGKRYSNKENCVWTLVEPDAGMISFELVTSGFEDCCDYITVNSSDQDGVSTGPSFKLTSMNPTASVKGSRVNVKFASDNSEPGTGFTLRYHIKLTEYRECGGAIIGDRGVISYKSGTRYLDNERCVWILHSPNSNSIKLKLLENGFESCCDFLLVNTIDPETGWIRNGTKKIKGGSGTLVIEGSLILITFYSDYSQPGNGFSLEFSANGENPDPEINFVVRHFSEQHGTVEYPSSELYNGRESNNIYVVGFSKTVHIPENYPTIIDWKHGIFQRSTDSCLFDSLSIYDAREGELVQRARFPNETDCEPFVNIPPEKEILEFPRPFFIAIFKPLSNENSFSFNYYNQHSVVVDCDEILEPLRGEYGQISYKESKVYTNNENCKWTVYVPWADTILFSLIKTGLDECCDTISVYSHSNLTEPPFQLTSWNRTVSVAGPNATVTFSSDEAVTGLGFLLRYQKET